ncbi:hypothetical protein [Gilliamella sp. wkB308]|uniref:hypothetical protein n=1 Tax=Gilliamella sp. wkB308 TaxID=3120263 RepID=UPI00080DC466|nr:hypothetical protein [Gilliamella apicola]OCF98774.1 hypothetical protein A9G10_05990 [Gilliamella apicola]
MKNFIVSIFSVLEMLATLLIVTFITGFVVFMSTVIVVLECLAFIVTLPITVFLAFIEFNRRDKNN